MQDLERRHAILQYLETNRSATVEFLSKMFYASPSTVRRDLTALERTGMVHRTHGGVIYNDKIKELSFPARKSKNEQAKNRIAGETINHIPDFNSIFVDNSTTCFPLIKLLPLNKKLLVTNSLLIAREAKLMSDAKVILLGGEYDIDSVSFSSLLTLEMLSNFHFDLVVQSCAYINSGGAFENEYLTAAIKKTAREASDRAILMFDRSKLLSSASCKSARLSDFDLIVSDINEEEKAGLNGNQNLNIVTVK